MSRVLVADDTLSVRMVLSALLKRAGHEVFVASCVSEGLVLFQANRPDAVLTDLNMASANDGLELARRIRALDGARRTRLALMTGDAKSFVDSEGLFESVLEKPVLLKDLRKFLEGEDKMKETIRVWLTEQFGPDEALFAELYGQYASDMKARAGKLDGLLAAGDAAMLGEEGHAMKGMALQMGDTDLSEPCLALQNAGRGGDVATCAELIPKISAAVAAL